jgi:drug/metabolite transporter (DMT)-like permease
MLDWKMLAVVGPLFFAIYQSLAKMLPKGTSTLVAGAYTFLLCSVLIFLANFIFSSNKSIVLTSKSIPVIVGMAVFLSLGNLSLISAYSLGAPQSIYSIIAYTVLILLGILFGALFWQEKLTTPVIFGTILSIAGILIIIYSRK